MANYALIGAASVAAATILLLGSKRKIKRRGPDPIVVVEPEIYEESEVTPSEDPLERIEELLDEHVSDVPRNGFFYQAVKGDTIENVARRVLERMGGTYTEQMLLDYIHCISSGSYNLGRYGTPSTTKTFPKKFLAPGIQRGLRVAFMPRNQNALALLRNGVMPKMVVDARTGAPKGTKDDVHYGLIWLPPIDPSDFEHGIVTCAPYQWEDGSSTIDPDPELLALAA